MKKLTKKVVALLLTVVMMLSMSISVFAQEDTGLKVTVNITAVDAVKGEDGMPVVGDTYTGTVVLNDVVAGTNVEAIVKSALPQIDLVSGASALDIKEGVWNVVPDWQKPEITYNVINGLKMVNDSVKFTGIDFEDDAAWFGYGWTYDGKDGTTPLNTYNYMSQNTINNTNSVINLQFAYYEYPKAA